MKLSMSDTRLARELVKKQAVIMKSKGDAFPAYPKGDRRKRPVCWVPQESFQTLSRFGGLKRHRCGYVVKADFESRTLKRADFANQHRDIEERDIYQDTGVIRPARVNSSLSAMDRLYRRYDKAGQRLLSEAEYEAGQRYARDYALAGYESLSSQNYMRAGEDKSLCFESHSNNLEARIDAKKRLEQADKAIGRSLSKIIIAVCCLDKSLDEVERAEKWAGSSGIIILKMGLDNLADYYGTYAGGKVA